MNIAFNPYIQRNFRANQPAFKSSEDKEIKESLFYEVIEPGILGKGGVLSREEEFKFVKDQGYKSILSLMKPSIKEMSDKYPNSEFINHFLNKEADLINKHNEKNPQDKIEFKSISLWNPDYLSKPDPEFELKKLQFIGLINRLPKPIYMHCIRGTDISVNMAEVFKEALKAGKIKIDKPSN